MKKQPFLGASLRTGLKFTSVMDDVEGMPPSNRIWTCNGLMQLFGDLCLNTLEGSDAYPIQSITIIARPLSDLTKPITHNGETFVPIVELAKIVDEFNNTNPTFVYVKTFSGWHYEWYAGDQISIRRSVPFLFYQKLIEWHFNLMDESEPFIPVTDEFNPYK